MSSSLESEMMVLFVINIKFEKQSHLKKYYVVGLLIMLFVA